MSTVPVSTQLVRARNLLRSSHTWTTETFGRDVEGSSCDARSPIARQWCALGALVAVDGRGYAADALHNVGPDLHPGLMYGDIVHVNDRLGFHAVRQSYDLAIQREREHELGLR